VACRIKTHTATAGSSSTASADLCSPEGFVPHVLPLGGPRPLAKVTLCLYNSIVLRSSGFTFFFLKFFKVLLLGYPLRTPYYRELSFSITSILILDAASGNSFTQFARALSYLTP